MLRLGDGCYFLRRIIIPPRPETPAKSASRPDGSGTGAISRYAPRPSGFSDAAAAYLRQQGGADARNTHASRTRVICSGVTVRNR